MWLAQQILLEWGIIVFSCRVRVHTVDSERFKELCDELSGLSANNILAVLTKLVELELHLTSMTN